MVGSIALPFPMPSFLRRKGSAHAAGLAPRDGLSRSTRLSCYLSTMRKHGRGVMKALVAACPCTPLNLRRCRIVTGQDRRRDADETPSLEWPISGCEVDQSPQDQIPPSQVAAAPLAQVGAGPMQLLLQYQRPELQAAGAPLGQVGAVPVHPLLLAQYHSPP